ncbi:RNA-binding S4 domain-containing protein [Microaerobacter geothermalis]|uniref:RNA-binding S4 domain-containing protein n=1 Tax=Microaerobacter geothermalis TaxID=674972 RepID=UPI001F2D7140|nr:RNA-binding S4 domain-containing protein [Microaerobacter geothermalis]MCF6094692.1 RNA-binding S4 domain-containing protein [Microaerobacter geothermalis]
MRLDKFLKVSRLIKRRTLAKEICDQGRVMINGVQGKASSTIKIGDTLSIRFGQKIITVQVEKLDEHVKKGDAGQLYNVIKEERIEEKLF